MKNNFFNLFIFSNKIQINFNILTNIINKFIINSQFWIFQGLIIVNKILHLQEYLLFMNFIINLHEKKFYALDIRT